MDVIQLLPDSVANQIAAGEVIQRPASVIKELVENAIDAGAKHIQVLVCDAGKTSIQVIDDGCGMSDTDARLSFERHATSKIRQAEDLFSLHTMGFRGEALASIAAVAQVTLQTRRAEAELGTRLVISGSHFVEQEAVSCPVGTNFMVENLFFNIPARRKFLKSNATEMSNITQCFERMVLVYPDIEFSLYNNGMEVMKLRQANTHQRIVDVFGKRINQQLLAIAANTSVCDISGFVGKPESAKKKGCHQFFFVNGRYMKHPYFHKAVLSAYDRLLPNGEQVSYFIYLKVKPEDIDVNIHPVKTEIKFENEQVVWQILMAAVRDAVGKFSEVTTLDFDTEGKPEIPVFQMGGAEGIDAPRMDFDPLYNPFSSTTRDASALGAGGAARVASGRSSSLFGSDAPKRTRAKGWEELFGSASSGKDSFSHSTLVRGEAEQTEMFRSSISMDDMDNTVPSVNMERSTEHYQYRGSYIVTQVATGLMMVDQNRASMRVLYEQYMKILENRTAHTQKVLFPEMVQFPPSYITMLDTVLEELRMLGFEITDLGGGSYAVAGVPVGLGGLDAVTLVNELVAEAVEQCGGATERVHDILAQGLARKAATPYGEVLTNEEMENLISQLLACKTQKYTPDGRVIISVIENVDIENRFR